MSSPRPNNPFATAQHGSSQGGSDFRREDRGGAYTIGDPFQPPQEQPSYTSTSQSQRSADVPHHTPNNPFVTSTSAPASPPYVSQQPVGTGASQARVPMPEHAAAVSNNPFQRTSPQSTDAQPQTAHKSQYSHDLIVDDLAGLDFNAASAPGVAPAASAAPMASTVASPSSNARDMASPSTPSRPVHQPIGSPTAAVNNAESSAPTTGQTQYAPPPVPPPGHVEEDHNRQGRQESSTERQHFDQMAADEEYARKLWMAENDSAQRGHGRGGSNSYSRQASQSTRQSQLRYAAPSSGVMQQAGGAAAYTSSQNPAPPRDSNAEKQWNTKEIYWQGRSQRIIVQNENGPCSLIALCNILLMRGTVQITPEDRPAVSYSYLSSMLGEHLIDAISSSADSALDLEAALSILPRTQEGLEVNVCFDAIDRFAVDSRQSSELPATNPFAADLSKSSSVNPREGGPSGKTGNTDKETQRGELALFKLCGVHLVHGWLADKSDAETWSAVVERAGNYDNALDHVVAGDDLAKGQVVGRNQAAQSSGSSSDIANNPALAHLSAQEKSVVKDAVLISRFLESTATQLTYPGLLALSTTLERGTLHALFRNSHLSVIYRPREDELLQAMQDDESQQSLNQPQLYQLVTDATLEGEDGIVWESLEDVDGSASRFFDGKFRTSHVQGDFAGQQPGRSGPGMTDEDADMAYAQQLQWQEQQRAERYAQQRNQHMARRRQQQGYGNSQNANSSVGSHGNIISRMLANRKQGRKSGAGTQSSFQFENNVANSMGGSANRQQQSYPPPPGSSDQSRAPEQLVDTNDVSGGTGGGAAPGEEIEQPSGGGKSKWWKRIL